MGVSVLINTFNEERNIRNCLECVKWADEIVIVDMYSDDATLEIAREYTDRIFMFERRQYADPARQFALEQATHEWVLVVDADELIPRRLRDCLLEVAAGGEYDAVDIPFRNYLFGHQMKGAGWAPLQDTHQRFFRKRFMRYSDVIHGFTHLDPSARVLRLEDESYSIIHLNYLDVEHFLEKLNRYTSIEARLAAGRGEDASLARLAYSVIKEIGMRLVLRKGYRDGFQGLTLSLLMASYRVAAALKLHLMRRYGSDNPGAEIRGEYEVLAARVIGEYDAARDATGVMTGKV